MNRALVSVANNFLNLIYPLHCAGCGRILDASNRLGVCDFCLHQIRTNPKPHCRRCGRSMQIANAVCSECRKTNFHFSKANSACLYEGVLKELIHKFKYGSRFSLSKVLSIFMIDFIRENDEIIAGIDVLTFVPLEFKLVPRRDFNHSKVLALNISREFGLPLIDSLRKSRQTRRQNELSRNERLINLSGAFETKKGVDVGNMTILLIDDVMTTGATLSECSKVLATRGASEVKCLTLARGV